MKRADYADPSKFSKAQREQLDRMPINLTRMLLHCPVEMVKSFYDLAWSFRSGNLDPRIREMVILRMATLRCSQYELSHHIPAAKIAGLNDQEIAEITSPNPTALDEKLTVMVRLTSDCAHDGRVSEATFESAAKIFSTAEIAEATLLAGFYEMLASFLETMRVGLDQHALNWSVVDPRSS